MKKRKVDRSLDVKLLGQEPMIAEITGRNDPELTRVFNYYNYMHDDKQSQKWLLQWMKEEKFARADIDVVRDAPVWASGVTAGWVARMAMNGTKFAPENIQYIRDKIDEIKTRFVEPVAEETEQPKVNIQERVKNKNNQLIAQAEEEVVDAFVSDISPISAYEFLTKYGATPSAAQQMKEFYQGQHDEVFSGDEQVKESFGQSLKKWQKFWTDLMSDIDRYLNNKKVVKVRKPRTVKVQPITKLIERLKYQKEFGPLKLVSVNPQEIIGAQQMWTYNTKYRILSVFHAEGPAGFGVKGTTLTGFSEELSTGKRLRKPEGILDEVLKAGKVGIKKILPGLTTSEIKPTGRINNDIIILRVIK